MQGTRRYLTGYQPNTKIIWKYYRRLRRPHATLCREISVTVICILPTPGRSACLTSIGAAITFCIVMRSCRLYLKQGLWIIPKTGVQILKR